MKIAFLLSLLFFSYLVALAQDTTQIVREDIVYFKNPYKQTEKIKKAYLKQVTTDYKDGTHKEEMVRLSNGSVYYQRILKNGQPSGNWTETTRSSKVIKINTADINYCLDKDTLSHEDDTLNISELKNEIYYTVVQNSHFPDEAKSLRFTGTVYVHFELSTENQIENSCITKSVHPILDLASLNTINNLNRFNNPLESRIKFKIPLRYSLK